MERACNCFEIAGDKLATGIRADERGVWLGDERRMLRGKMLPYSSIPENSPPTLVGHAYIRVGKPVPQQVSTPNHMTIGNNDDARWAGALVRVQTWRLVFEWDRITQKKLNLWTGGEGDVRPIAQLGAHNDRHKDQIFALNSGDSVFIVAPDGRIGYLVCEERPILRAARSDECLSYLTRKALGAREHRALHWALHNMDAFGKEARALAEDILRERPQFDPPRGW